MENRHKLHFEYSSTSTLTPRQEQKTFGSPGFTEDEDTLNGENDEYTNTNFENEYISFHPEQTSDRKNKAIVLRKGT